MPQEAEQQVVQIVSKGTEMTARTLWGLMKHALEMKKQAATGTNAQTATYTGNPSVVFGEQSLESLNRQGRELESVRIMDEDIKNFRETLGEYHVDFSIQQDRNTGNIHVFFKAQDTGRIYQGMQACVDKFSPELVDAVTKKAEQRKPFRRPVSPETEKPENKNRPKPEQETNPENPDKTEEGGGSGNTKPEVPERKPDPEKPLTEPAPVGGSPQPSGLPKKPPMPTKPLETSL